MKVDTIVGATAVVTAMLLSGTVAASAAMFWSTPKASDSLNLSSAQQETAWKDLDHATDQKAPAGFDAAIGTKIPTTIKISAMPSKATSDVSQLRPYDFAKVRDKLLIVNPSDRMIAEVITG